VLAPATSGFLLTEEYKRLAEDCAPLTFCQKYGYFQALLYLIFPKITDEMIFMTPSKLGFIISAICTVGYAEPTLAQVSTSDQQVTLDRMRASPTDHENTYAYVRASITARDYEAAIAALERILQYNPGLSRAKYELGVLYFRLGSFAKAVLHFEDAATDASLDPNIRRRLDGFLPDARKELQASRFYGVLQTGLRYSSNKNGSLTPAGPVQANLFPLRNGGGTSAFILGDVSHIYDFQNQRGDRWETGLSGFASHQFSNRDMNVAFFDISTGPRLALVPDWLPGVTIRPYVGGGSSFVGGNSYSNNFGGGVSLRVPFSPFFAVDFGIDGRKVDVAVPGVGLSRDILATGSLWSASIGAKWSVTDYATFNGKAFIRRNKADNNGFDSDHAGLEASLKIDFDAPVESIGFRWSATPYVRYTSIAFKQIEVINTGPIRRKDQQLRAGLQLDTPLTRHIGFSSAFEFTQNLSNIRNYRSTGWSVMAGPTIRF
jgi:Tetratricopeptide repeat